MILFTEAPPSSTPYFHCPAVHDFPISGDSRIVKFDSRQRHIVMGKEPDSFPSNPANEEMSTDKPIMVGQNTYAE